MITDGLFFVVNFCMFDFFLVVSDNRHRRVRDQEDFTTRVSLVVVRVRGLPVELDTINHVSRFFAQFSQWLYAYVRIIRLHIADNALCPSLRCVSKRAEGRIMPYPTNSRCADAYRNGALQYPRDRAGVGSGVREQERSMKAKPSGENSGLIKPKRTSIVRVYGK